jgi:hypothetical protein
MIHNVETNEINERDMNAEELKQWESDNLQATERAEAEEKKANDKAALLKKLKITEDEAKLLLS